MFGEDSFIRRHKFLTALIILLLIGGVWLRGRMRGPFPDYNLDLTLPAAGAGEAAGQLQVGVAMRDITPNMDDYDPWTDVNGNGKFEDKIDTYVDRNKNGKFDPAWVAGFNSNRPATGVHDPQWVRAIALRNNGVTIVMASLDSIGIFNNDYVAIRKMLDPALKIDHVLFSATHCHETVDTMKIWSGNTRIGGLAIPIFGYDDSYLKKMHVKAKEAIEEAVKKLEAADMYCAVAGLEPEGFVDDSRKPIVFDNHLYAMRFTKPGTDDTIATFVNWGNHPETTGGSNGLLSSDFPHYLREGVEKGVPEPNGAPGLNGMCLYFQGQVGGLMTSLHTTVPSRDGVNKYRQDSFEKTQALGENLAIVALHALRGPNVWKNENPRIAFIGKSYYAAPQGPFKWAMLLGLIHEGYKLGKGSRTEGNALRIGDVAILGVPGEIYPEIVEGGVEARPGRDFEIDPVEVPPLREYLAKHARMGFVIGLCNDEIGYIVPKSQWDTKPPWTYGNKDQYGEQNSPGPETAPMIHQNGVELLGWVNEDFAKNPASSTPKKTP